MDSKPSSTSNLVKHKPEIELISTARRKTSHQAIDNHTTLNCEKIFHVSPFFAVEGEYQFRFVHRQNTRTVAIKYVVNQQLTLKTVVTGQAQDLNFNNICQQLAKLGWTTVLVVARIHWQALKLWRKGAIFHRKPLPPQMEISS